MPAIVNRIEKNSIAEELDILPNDEIVSIDGIVPKDLIDYKFLISSENIELHIKRGNGEEEIIEIEKDVEEDLGIIFESAVFDKVMPCTNKCVFCFVDQQPEGLRDSLYVKDDDYRLSYLQGTYITLTNLRKQDRERIENMRLGPLYISVHTTTPELRAKMLGNPKAANIMQELKWLNTLEIPVHTQIVVCPDLNDKKELDKTLQDLASLKSNVMSIAIVPVGTTKFRTKDVLNNFTKEQAEELIAQINDFNKTLDYNLAFPSDEFYDLAEYNYPEYDFYKEFGQLDDGVGTSRMILDDFNLYKNKLPKILQKPLTFTIATGEIAAKVFGYIVDELNHIENLNINLVPIKSNFWGEKITVSGLITGKDLIENLLPYKDNLPNLLIPSVMIRKYTDSFLDDIKIPDIEKALNTKIFVIQNYYSTRELVEFILDCKVESVR